MDDNDIYLQLENALASTNFIRLRNAIMNSNIGLIQELFTVANISSDSVSRIICKPELYPTLKFLLEDNNELCDYVREIIVSDINISNYISHNITPELLHIVLSYLPTDKILQNIFDQSIYTGNLKILDILFTAGYDIVSAFDKTNFKLHIVFGTKCEPKINFNTFMHLGKLGIDMLKYINIVCMEFCHGNDVNGLVFCLENGIDPNYVFSEIRYLVNIDIIKCLVDHGGDLNKLKLVAIKNIMADHNVLAIIYLVESGLDISNYLYDLIVICIYSPNITIKYLLNMGVTTDMLNKLLLLACDAYNTEHIKLLLDYGADIHCNNNMILNYIDQYPISHRGKTFSTAKFLIKQGAIPNDPFYTFCLYVANTSVCKFDEELFTYLLDLGIDLNGKFDSNIKKRYISKCVPIEYILDVIVSLGQMELLKLCLKYGADPYINNHSPITVAVKTNSLSMIKFLLDLGSVVDCELEYIVSKSIISLLDEYQINHKLTNL